MFISKLKKYLIQERRPRLSELEEYILSKDPKSPQDVEYWTRMYDLRPHFVTHHLMPVAGMLR